MLKNKRWLLCLALGWGVAWGAAAPEPLELSSKYEHYTVHYALDESGRAETAYDWAMTVLKKSAVESAKDASVSYSTSLEQIEVLAAYTKKKDGRKLDAPKSNFQVETNTGHDKNAPVFSDRTTLTVVFPDVEVGDTVTFVYKLKQIEPMFPQHFSEVESLSKQVAYDDARISVDAPLSLGLAYHARGMQETKNEQAQGRLHLEWHYANPQPLKDKRKDYSVLKLDEWPGVSLSTFKSYEQIAQVYGERALPKAKVSPAIQKLADEITQGQKSKREQVKSLYEWVATNITYAGNCIGLGVGSRTNIF